jgi:RNA polymerase sigma-70 factor (ECF subfamily)
MLLAFRQLYDAHVRFVLRVLVRLGVPESDVADAVQDVFVVVHRRLPEFEGRAKPTTWLFEICLRVASDRRNLAHLRREVPSDDPSLSDIEAPGDEMAALERREARALLDRILNRMPEAQRIAFVLFELEQMTAEEIAELLDVPVGTVRSRLRLARVGFRQAVRRLQARGAPAAIDTAGGGLLRASEVWR